MPKRTQRRMRRGGGFFDSLSSLNPFKKSTPPVDTTPLDSNYVQQNYGNNINTPYNDYDDAMYRGERGESFGGGRRRKTRKTRKGRKSRSRSRRRR